MSRIVTWVRAVVAVAVLVVLVAAPPLLLARYVGNPWPAEGVAVSAPLTDGAVIGLLAVLCWVLWAQLVVCVLVEAGSAVAGVGRPRRIPVTFGAQQYLARRLIFAVLAVAVSAPAVTGMASAASASASPPPPTTVTLTVAGALAAAPDSPAHHKASPHVQQESAGLRLVHVARGDSLWALAEAHLGAGERWSQIADLNRARTMVDGRVFQSADLIQPGWDLLMPADATGLPLASDPPAPEEWDREVTVHRGDTLSSIADRELGDATLWPQVAQANADVVADPDVITPGTHLVIPSQSTVETGLDDPTGDADQPGHTDQASADAGPAHEDAPEDQQPPAPSPAEQSPPVEESPPVETAPAQPSSTAQQQAAPAADEEDAVSMQTVTGVGALLAAGVLGLIATRRTNQRRRRRVGQSAPQPPPGAVAVEHQLRGVGDPLGVDAVDKALRGLVVACEQTTQPLPVVRAGRLTATQFELYLAEPAQLPAPWVDMSDGTVWTLPSVSAERLDVDVDQVVAPYPSLVTVGVDDEEGHVFLDLEYVQTLGVAGDPEVAREVLAAIAVELATSRWADDLQVTIVGAYPELEDVLETGRIRYLPAVGHLLDDLVSRAGRDRQILATVGSDGLNHARVEGVAAGAWTPEIVLLATELTSSQRSQVAGLVDQMPRVAVATVLGGEPVGEWAMRLAGRRAVIEPIGLQVRPQRIDAATYEQILELVAVAGDDPVDTGDHVPVEVTLDDLPSAAAEVTVDASPEGESVGAAAELTGVQAWLEVNKAVSAPDETVDETAAGDLDETRAEGNVQVGDVVADAEIQPIPRRAPRILLLGHVDVVDTHGPQVEARRRQTVLELAAFLALNPGADRHAVTEAVWHGRDVSDSTRWSTMSRLRRWLGEAVEGSGDWYLPPFEADDQYAFDKATRTDWDEWNRLIPAGAGSAPTEHLEQALSLVRGQPFANAPRTRYDWADPVKEAMIEATAAAALELARRRLMDGRWRAAEQAAVVGLAVEPVMEQLWRMRILAAHSSGNHEAVREAVDRLLVIADRVGGDLEPETEDLLAQLRADELPVRRPAAEN